MSEHILPWHIMTFQALTRDGGDTFMLLPCFIGETPSAAIAMYRETRSGVEVMPLFVAITRDMDINCPDSEGDAQGGDSSSGGGPDRNEIQRQFAANMSLTDPH